MKPSYLYFRRVKENRYDILISTYEASKSILGEIISQIYKRFMLLLNELTLHDKTYPQEEINRNLILVMSPHLVNKTESIRKRSDFRSISLEKLFEKIKTFVMELEQRKIIYEAGSLEAKHAAMQKTTALLADVSYFAYQELIDYGQNDYSSAKSD